VCVCVWGGGWFVSVCACACVFVRVCVSVCVRACASIKHLLIYVISFDAIQFERKGGPSTGGAPIQVWF
jgi:hypothetical protein